MSRNIIELGTTTYDDSQIKSGNCRIRSSIAVDELGIDTLDMELDGSQEIGTIFCPADADAMLTNDDKLFTVRPYFRVLIDDFSQYQYGLPVLFKHDGKLIGKFYMSSWERIGKFNFSVSCVSAVGLLESLTHFGELYNGQKFSEVVSDIIGGAVSYSVSANVKDIAIYGWLPKGTRRSNLHQLLFATGANARKDANGDLYFDVMDFTDVKSISDDRIFLGGRIESTDFATRAEVTEHAFFSYPDDEQVTLFEGDAVASQIITPSGQSVSGVLVDFEEPMHNLKVENGTILESGVNYAVLGNSLSCKLTGRKYTHTTRIVVATPAQTMALVEQNDKTVRVTGAYLVSLLNSEAVASRVLSYYSSARIYNTDLVVGEEKPGDAVSLTDPFDEQASGLLKSLDINISGLLRASAEITTGYTPSSSGNYYENYVVITENTQWVSPVDGKIRIVLIQGGTGGQGGENGEDGEHGPYHSPGTGKSGLGGQAGVAGQGGKIAIFDVTVSKGQTFAVSVGAAGAGGKNGTYGDGGSAGTEGGETTFGAYSSASGSRSSAGYINIFDGKAYARPGYNGTAGGDASTTAGRGPDVVWNGLTFSAGMNGTSNLDPEGTSGGLGGGAAVGASGQNGDNGGLGIAGHGGNGGTPSAFYNPFETPGCGGHGGHGGGGGGGGGGSVEISASGGFGGSGSSGQNGNPGCAIVYY